LNRAAASILCVIFEPLHGWTRIELGTGWASASSICVNGMKNVSP
jgi:hypothetical protein